jgi:hypothetical protein
MRVVEASVDIAASPERVWEVLTDLDSFAAWNPFMTKASGHLVVGSPLSITIEPPGGRSMSFRPKVLEVEPNRRLRWLGRPILPGLFDGEHSFVVEPQGANRSRFTQSERFSGIFTWFSNRLFQRTEAGFRAMNAALKERCEAS